MAPYWAEHWGNSSSRHSLDGLNASAAVSVARDRLASFLGATPERLIFTSGATEANNLALLGHARASAMRRGGPGHLITLATEHRAVLDPLRRLQREGFTLTELLPGADGLLDMNQLIEAIQKDTILVSIMAGNNEIGVIQPLSEIGSICKANNITFHSDAAQSFGHIPLFPDSCGIKLLSLSAHKLYGPKGIGALLFCPDVAIEPIAWGGSQERSLRPGTVPVPLVVGFSKAAEFAFAEIIARGKKLKFLRNQLWDLLRVNVPNLMLNGSLEDRLPHNLNITIPGINGRKLLREIRPLISCSSGSACSMGEPSHVLQALGRTKEEARSSLRLSLGRDTTLDDVHKVVKVLVNSIEKLQKIDG